MTSPQAPVPHAPTDSPARNGTDARTAKPLPVHREPVMAMPTRLLLSAMVVTSLLVTGLWSAVVAIGPWGSVEFKSGLIGIGTTAAMAIVGLLVMTPWKQRPMGDWMTLWLAGTVFRLLGTPVVLYLLYSAASAAGSAPAVKPLALSVALTYLVMVLAEAGIIASHVRRLLPSP